ncbi:deoxynucleoside kinase [Promethearchaeum syntrophicum]|uniref:Deoxynucleoside kinase n=1 Tax=Promethearchaeum syntrophicum TaxID=2594042 RepID=A0A5B9DB74_9ARCH|nr:deoxynucleoside kinase [Candidatus Prometheoarchaeum syntrophicum]
MQIKGKKTKSIKKHKTKRSRSKGDGFVFSIAGVHGVGKTTVYLLLQKKLIENKNILFMPERLRANPPVPFGSKDKNIAFRAELHYNQQMIKRNEIIKKFVTNHRERICISDRTPFTTIAYARALSLPKIDYSLINDTFTSVSWQKDHIIFLNAEPKTIMQRIYHRGSLDISREKWNEGDFEYLKRVLKKYEEIFIENKIEKNNRITRIWTENMTAEDVVNRIIEIIEQRTRLLLKKQIKVPVNQSKLTNWIPEI